MFHTIFYFILALLILIVIHEFGHFITARLFGVKVLRFSFGFGKVLARWKSRKDTEYVFSLFPLGGYVKMLDESEGPVPEHEKHLAFNNQPLWTRFLIVLAGPLFNFIFAFFALWLMWVVGFNALAPIIEEVKPNSMAYQAGLRSNQEIIALNGRTINSWRDFQYEILPLIGGDEPLKLAVRSLSDQAEYQVSMTVDSWTLDQKKPNLLKSFGIVPFIPKIPPIVGEVVENTPASKGGIQRGDEIKSIDHQSVNDWIELVQYIKNRPGQWVTLIILRKKQIIEKRIEVGQVKQGEETSGFLGLKSKKMDWPGQWLRKQKKGPMQAAQAAMAQTYHLTEATFALIGRLIIGKIPLQTLSGPVGIAQGAGDSAKGGFAYYLSFLALVSVSLGVLNLLPIPLLDGGHLFFYFIELIRRKPLTDETKSIGMYVGMVFLVTLMVIAIGNDLARLSH